MSRKAILVVSFGTSHEDSRKKTIEAIEQKIAEEFKEYKIYRAFTSKMIIKKLAKSGLHIMTVEEALKQMKADGVKELIVQPTHVINGIENDEMMEDIKAVTGEFDSVVIGRPLLNDTKDYKRLAQAVVEDNPLAEDEILMLMGHGTTHYSNSAYPALEYVFKEMGYANILVGTVEGYPSFEEAMKQLEKTNKKKVTLLPLMIVAGDHANNDMAGEEDSWKSRLEQEGYQVVCRIKGLGELDKVQEQFIEHIRAAKSIV